MVLPLGPGKFYGSSLPRPRIYNDLKFNSERVDPPMSVTAPLLSWAMDARWSKGGLSHKRKHLHGKIEGSFKRLRAMEEEETEKKVTNIKKKKEENIQKETEENESPSSAKKGSSGSDSPKIGGSKICPSSADSSPAEAQLLKQNWGDEDFPTIVLDSVKKSENNRLPSVRRRIRKLGEVFNQQAQTLTSSDDRNGTPKALAVASSASKRQQTEKEKEAYDYVAVPDKIMRAAPQRKTLRKSDKDCAGIEPASLGSSVRRSSRISSSNL